MIQRLALGQLALLYNLLCILRPRPKEEQGLKRTRFYPNSRSTNLPLPSPPLCEY